MIATLRSLIGLTITDQLQESLAYNKSVKIAWVTNDFYQYVPFDTISITIFRNYMGSRYFSVVFTANDVYFRDDSAMPELNKTYYYSDQAFPQSLIDDILDKVHSLTI